MNIEYEYSFKVTDLKPFIKFIEDNKFIKIDENYQSRTLYKKEDKTMARITVSGKNSEESKIIFDFKDDEDSDNLLKERRETLPLEITNIEIAKSIIEFLGYKENKTLIRKRQIFKKEDVEFELDEYESPEKMLVVAIEGNKDKVDEIYHEMETNLIEYFMKK